MRSFTVYRLNTSNPIAVIFISLAFISFDLAQSGLVVIAQNLCHTDDLVQETRRLLFKMAYFHYDYSK